MYKTTVRFRFPLITLLSFVIISLSGLSNLNAQDDGLFVEASVNDVNFRVEGKDKCLAYIFAEDNIGIYGMVNMEEIETSEGVVMSFGSECKVGTYPLIGDNKKAKYMVYYTGPKGRYISFSEQGGTLTITAVDDQFISGSFEYIGVNKAKETFPVTGSFKVAKLKI